MEQIGPSMGPEARRGGKAASTAPASAIPVTLVTARGGPAPASRLEVLKDLAIVMVAGTTLAALVGMVWWTAVGSAAGMH
jgi:hypothetical protein